MTSPFFLTRQTANLMEDFMRELKAGAALFLLYGESGVGKTRLLQELGRNRLADSRIHWLDLGDGGRGGDPQDASKAKDSLPEVLRKTSPIVRSVGGILKEIRRLEAES